MLHSVLPIGSRMKCLHLNGLTWLCVAVGVVASDALSQEKPSVVSSTKLPFAATSFVIDQAGRVILWQADSDDDGSPATSSRVAIVEPDSGKVLDDRTFGLHITGATATSNHLVLAAQFENRVEVLKLTGLTPVRTILPTGLIWDVQADEANLLVSSESAVEHFAEPGFERTRRVVSPNARLPAWHTEYGCYTWGTLYDFTLEPKLAQYPMLIKIESEAAERARNARRTLPPAQWYQSPAQGLLKKVQVSSSRVVSKHLPLSVLVPGTHLMIRLDGAAEQKQFVFQKQVSEKFTVSNSDSHVLRAHGNSVFLASGETLRQWQFDSPKRFRFVPQQSAFVLGNGPNTRLAHRTQHGKAPVVFSLLDQVDGVSLDTRTGVITLDHPTVRRQIDIVLQRVLSRSSDQTTALQRLLARSRSLKLEGFGDKLHLALPVAIKATDATGATATLNYEVVLEANAERLLQLAGQWQKAATSEFDTELAAAKQLSERLGEVLKTSREAFEILVRIQEADDKQ